jgi:hypothetical protein
MAKLSPIGNNAQFINGIPANGAKLFTYAAGSSTKQTTYADEAGTIPQTNPIILDSRGEPTQPIWLTEGLSYKFVFTASTDSDPPVSPIWDIDDVTGINDASLTIDQWVDSGVTPTYVSANSFTLPGDQTTAFHNKRRFKALVTAGTVYGTFYSSVFGALTTVTAVMDSTPLDSGLSSIQLSLLTATNPSTPSIVESYRATVAATATTTPLWASTAQVQDWTGTPTITAFPASTMPGQWRIAYPAAGTIITDNANISVQGGATYTTAAEDKIIITAVTTSTVQVDIRKGDGTPIANSFASAATFNIGTNETQSLNSKIVRENLIVNGALVTLTGTSVDFTGVPAWAKEITLEYIDLSTNGTSTTILQIGDAGGIETTGYSGAAGFFTTSSSASAYTTGFGMTNTQTAATVYTGSFVLRLMDAATNLWLCVASGAYTSSGVVTGGSGQKALSATLDRLRITMVNGTDAFDGTPKARISWK